MRLMPKVISLETLRTYYEDKDWMLDRIDRLELDLRMLKVYGAVCGGQLHSITAV